MISFSDEIQNDDEPCYVISIVSRLVGLHQQTLRYYERAGLIQPHRTPGNIRMYSNTDIRMIRQAQRLIAELGVNLAGVEVILKLNEQIRDLQTEMVTVRAELNRLSGTQIQSPVVESNARHLKDTDSYDDPGGK
jgi:MerR family transcriptional regulator/heat shock protein HspR